MKCINCGAEVEEGNKFCPYCGTALEAEEAKEEVVAEAVETTVEEVEENQVEQPAEEPAVWKIFAIIGFVLGIVSLAGSILFVGLATGIPGIVFSALGKKSQANNKKARTGLKLSIAGLVISVVIYVIIIVVAAVLAVLAEQ